MIFEIQSEILGRLTLQKDISFQWHPYNIAVKKGKDKYFITLQKKIKDLEKNVPTIQNKSGILHISMPNSEFYKDAIDILQHLESFGALDNRLSRIDIENLTYKWIPESENEHLSPFSSISRKFEENQHSELTEEWIKDTLTHRRMMGNLYVPFSFFRDGKNFYNERRYQSAFCSFYMMLEFFFNDKGWGIDKNAHLTKKCLTVSLRKTLTQLPEHPNHYLWLNQEIERRGKKYDEESLLFLLNRFRDEFSHANDNERNKNLFRENNYISISFIIMMVCCFVSIKKRLLPFVRKDDIDRFLEK